MNNGDSASNEGTRGLPGAPSTLRRYIRPPVTPRPVCPSCRRPERVCVCASVRTAQTRTHVVFVQHPREARVPISTCRLAHRSLPGSEMFVTMEPERLPQLAARLAEPGAMVLFPGPGSVDVNALSRPPATLVVIDGTWSNARKLIERSPLLSGLPRLGFTPSRPSAYRIRREPALHCLSTIEAVVTVLEALEQAPGRFAPMLQSFTAMVDKQLTHIGGPTLRPGRHAVRQLPSERLRALGDRLVLLAAEAGGDGHEARLSWVAVRPSTGERFVSLLVPDRPLGSYVPDAIDLPVGVDLEPFAAANARWASFARPDDVVGSWGRFHSMVLVDQGVEVGEHLDMKHFVTDALHRRIGGVERLAEQVGATLPTDQGRPARVLAAMEAVLRALMEGALAAGQPGGRRALAVEETVVTQG